MAEVNKINYTIKDLLVLMLKDQGIHEGNWILGATYSITAMNIGKLPDGTDAAPASVAAIQTIHIERVPEPLPFSLNAADVNPMT